MRVAGSGKWLRNTAGDSGVVGSVRRLRRSAAVAQPSRGAFANLDAGNLTKHLSILHPLWLVSATAPCSVRKSRPPLAIAAGVCFRSLRKAGLCPQVKPDRVIDFAPPIHQGDPGNQVVKSQRGCGFSSAGLAKKRKAGQQVRLFHTRR